jgi:hypothetical protein
MTAGQNGEPGPLRGGYSTLFITVTYTLSMTCPTRPTTRPI